MIAAKLHSLNRTQKSAVILLNDFALALVCWLVFGPPMATYIASEFSTGILKILYSEWQSFFIPAFRKIPADSKKKS